MDDLCTFRIECDVLLVFQCLSSILGMQTRCKNVTTFRMVDLRFRVG